MFNLISFLLRFHPIVSLKTKIKIRGSEFPSNQVVGAI